MIHLRNSCMTNGIGLPNKFNKTEMVLDFNHENLKQNAFIINLVINPTKDANQPQPTIIENSTISFDVKYLI